MGAILHTPGAVVGQVIRATAPVRICDIGGWTDTWFARTGAVLSVAVEPGVEVRVVARAGGGRPQVDLAAPDLGERYAFDPTAPPGRLPLLEATVAASSIPGGLAVDVEVRASVPPGCGTGTSAAVVVALLGALDRLTPGRTPPLELARAAHQVEVEGLGQQSGVQDQLAAACGGVNRFEVRYPEASVHPIALSTATAEELGRRLVLVSLGRPHRSSAIHEEVIARLAGSGGESPALEVLRRAARSAATAVGAGDLASLGSAMVVATEATRSLHPALVSPQAEELVAAARRAGAVGWKPNGAGGEGGSLSLLAGPGAAAREVLLEAIGAVPGPHQVLPVRLARSGLTVTVG